MRENILIIVIAIICFVASSTEAAPPLHVSNAGFDSTTCGGKKDPCRSISQAIANAPNGGRIIVGPGTYGDLNRNGDYSDPGDEAAEAGSTTCDCMIKIDKSISLESSHGPTATVIDAFTPAGPLFSPLRGVSIDADNVTFGKRDGGFTIINARREGVMVWGNDVRVEGNVARQDGALGNAAFSIQGGFGRTIIGNAAINNFNIGFGVHSNDYTVTGNIASGNVLGIAVSCANCIGKVSHNLISDNITHGLQIGVAAGDIELRRNDIINNLQHGVVVNNFDGIITQNNFYGNGSNCGIDNSAGEIDAPRNFWGAADGPGPDPADLACDSVNPPSTTFYAPVATKKFKIRVQAMN